MIRAFLAFATLFDANLLEMSRNDLISHFPVKWVFGTRESPLPQSFRRATTAPRPAAAGRGEGDLGQDSGCGGRHPLMADAPEEPHMGRQAVEALGIAFRRQ